MSLANGFLCGGLQPQPLAAYLASLGTLRSYALQRDPRVRGWFSPEGFRISGVAEKDLATFLLEEWRPSPIVNPWNNASGFYLSSKGRLAMGAMDAFAERQLHRPIG